ncbi:MAG: hypothetical protein E7673_05830 [Ruminococcaceae bacterium]|nr:hypothetical protein [Oscillospiraceae bacterium]
MPENELINVANNAEMIVNGYAFTKKNGGYSVLNLANPDKAMFLSTDGKMLETNMEPIEQALVLSYYKKNRILLEDDNA